MPALRHYLGVARAPFLALPVTLVALGTAAFALDGEVSGIRALLALIGLVAMHVAVNALNEASDLRTGIDLETERTPFSGGSGTLPSGALQPRHAYGVAFVAAAIAAAVGAWFLVRIGWPLVPILLAGAFFTFGYTDLLARLGIGEIAAGLGLGALPVIGAALVQDGRIGTAALAASVPAFFMTFNLLLLNEFPDEEADRRGGRRHLVILLGRRWAARVYVLAAVATPVAVAVSVSQGWLPRLALLGILPSLLLVKPVSWALRRPREPVPVPALGANVIWILSTNSLLALGIALAFILAD
jgi:1,4-dihydroxy-2-naphthoate octaprenyltransferase